MKNLIDKNNEIFDKLELFENLPEKEKKDYAAQASNIWQNQIFQQEIRRLVAQQIEHLARYATNWEAVLGLRGTINGIDLVFERFRELHGIYLGYLEDEKNNN